MKKLVVIIASLALVSVASAQSRVSVANYKMSREAAKAKATNADNILFHSYQAPEKSGLASSANYKNSFAAELGDGALIPFLPVEISNNALANAGNYKTQSGRASGRSQSIIVPVQPENPADVVSMNY